jgi:hypothetical protein
VNKLAPFYAIMRLTRWSSLRLDNEADLDRRVVVYGDNMETRRCVICGEIVERSHYAKPANRTACSRRCAAKLPKGPTKARKHQKINNGGYNNIPRYMLTPKDEILCPPDGKHFVLEHRLIMARHLGRPLKKGEVVRHLNGVKNDNRIENLALGDHKQNSMDHVTIAAELEKTQRLVTFIFGLYAHERQKRRVKKAQMTMF